MNKTTEEIISFNYNEISLYNLASGQLPEDGRVGCHVLMLQDIERILIQNAFIK
jgi:hypothetical protein